MFRSVTPILALCLATSFAAAGPPDPVAVVNGEPIPRAELDAVLGQRPPVVTPLTAAQERSLKQEALATLVDELILRQFLKKNAPPVSKADVDRQDGRRVGLGDVIAQLLQRLGHHRTRVPVRRTFFCSCRTP